MMKDIRFDNGEVHGSMVVNPNWYKKQTETDGWKLYLLAKDDPEAEMLVISYFSRNIKKDAGN